MNVLIVEDEPRVASFITRGLAESGHHGDTAKSGEMGLKLALENTYDVLILDLILPGINGQELCKKIRTLKGYETPIIMLTALGSTDDVVAGLQTGADDYMVKPFKFRELLARLEALYRRRKLPESDTIIQVGDLKLDHFKHTVQRNNIPIKLSPREYELLLFLMKNEGRILSRETLLTSVWEMDWDVETNVVDVYINYLRNKVDKPFPNKLIKTVIGMGYILTTEDLS